MEIFDFHAHIYPEKIARKAVKSVGDFYGIEMDCDGTAQSLIEKGKKAGASRFLVQSVATAAGQACAINDFIARECAAHRELTGFGTLHPGMEDPLSEIERIQTLGLKGVKFHPDTQKFNMDDDRMFPIYDALRQEKLPILMHCGDYRYTYSHPVRLRRVLDNFPGLTVIGAHFGGWTLWDLALEYLKDTSCYVDCSSSIMFLGKVRSRELIRLYGAQRVLYGTDFPMWDEKEEIARVQSLGLSTEELELIFSGNAKRLLGETT